MLGRSATTDAGAATLSSPGFVGRERELALIAAGLTERPAVVLVEGEAGIGKSRLIREYLAAPAARPHAVVVSCPPFRQPFTLGPIVDALRQTTDRISELRLTALGGALRPLLPEWADSLPPSPEPLADAAAARHRLFRALDELLDRLGVRVLVVEDAHWADEATLEFLLFVVSRQPRHLSLVVTYRPEDVPAGSLLRRLSSRATTGAVPLRIQLRPFDVTETAQLVSSMVAGEQVSEVFAKYLHEHTEGLPLAVEETVRLLGDRRDMRRRGGTWVRRAFDHLAVPATVRDAVLERYERFSGAAQHVLQAAAVLGEPFDEPMLRAVTDLGPDETTAGLTEALASGLVTEDGQGLMAYRHSMACRVVYGTIAAPERHRMHLHAGQALETRVPLPIPQLAAHFRAAEQYETWCRYAERAADIAAAAGDDTTGIAVLNDLAAQANLPIATRVRLAKQLAEAAGRRRSESVDLATQTVRTIRTVLDAPDLSPPDRAEIRYLLSRLLQQLADFDAALAELELAVPDLAHLPLQQADAMISLGDPRAGQWPLEQHLDWLRRAAELPTDSFTRAERLRLAVARAATLVSVGDEAGWDVAARTIAEATDAGELRLAMLCHFNTGHPAMTWGRYADAGRHLDAALELADIVGHSRIRNGILASQAHLHWLTGDWADLAERLATLVDTDDAGLADQQEAAMVMGLLEAATGDGRVAERRLRLVLGPDRSGAPDLSIEAAAALAGLCLADGRIDEALALTEDPIRFITGKPMWMWATDLAQARVETLIAAGRVGEAAGLVTAFADGLAERDAPAVQAAVANCRAVLAAGQGEWSTAAEAFGRVATAWLALPRPYAALRAREWQGRCLLRNDRDAGLAVMADVLRDLTARGALADADRVARVLREHGLKAPRVWRGGRRGYGDQLSPRELEVVRLVVNGLTNREIADALHRSPKTVDTQLHSAMRKLGVSSRTALAVNAVEGGLVADRRAGGIDRRDGTD